MGYLPERARTGSRPGSVPQMAGLGHLWPAGARRLCYLRRFAGDSRTLKTGGGSTELLESHFDVQGDEFKRHKSRGKLLKGGSYLHMAHMAIIAALAVPTHR